MLNQQQIQPLRAKQKCFSFPLFASTGKEPQKGSQTVQAHGKCCC